MKIREQKVAGLVEYIAEHICDVQDSYDPGTWQDYFLWIKEAIEAYESINDVEIDVFDAYGKAPAEIVTPANVDKLLRERAKRLQHHEGRD
jgi:hypothetical protein